MKESVNTDQQRVSNFSSSRIHCLTSKGRGNWSIDNVGAPFHTYVEEKVMEYRLGKQLENEHAAKPTTWGTHVEQFGFDEVSIHYKLESKKRYFHDTVERWCGAPDIITAKVVGDIKCPWTLKSFCSVVDKLSEVDESEIAETLKSIKPEYYWQLISNGILTKKDKAVLVLFVPYEDQLDEIRSASEGNPDLYWLWSARNEELPSLKKGGYYKSCYEFEFGIPKEDKRILTERVIKANFEFNKAIGR